jgi:lipoate-protein ligase A
VGGEVLIDGKKVVGSAQLRLGNAFLQHGSLLLEDDQALVRELGGDSAAVASELPLSRCLGRTVGFGEAAEAVRRAAERWTGPWLCTGENVPVLERADRHAGRFQDEGWTWER